MTIPLKTLNFLAILLRRKRKTVKFRQEELKGHRVGSTFRIEPTLGNAKNKDLTHQLLYVGGGGIDIVA